MPSKDRNPSVPENQPQSTGEELRYEFQQIQLAWEMAEEKLHLTRIPIDIQVEVGSGPIYDDTPEQVGNYTTWLAYQKCKGKWRICWVKHETFLDGTENDYEIKPVVETPIDTRIEMFDHYDTLYEHAEAICKSYVPKLREAREKFLERLGPVDMDY